MKILSNCAWERTLVFAGFCIFTGWLLATVHKDGLQKDEYPIFFLGMYCNIRFDWHIGTFTVIGQWPTAWLTPIYTIGFAQRAAELLEYVSFKAVNLNYQKQKMLLFLTHYTPQSSWIECHNIRKMTTFLWSILFYAAYACKVFYSIALPLAHKNLDKPMFNALYNMA